MRDTLYFKDDDARLSFLMGNYITLTNLTEREAQRIIDLRISPINVSVQATEPQLRRTLLGNKDADKSLEYMRAFGEAGIEMNGQIVVCPGWNDSEHLRRSIEDLMDIGFNSCSIVPVGLTKFRKGLARLEPVTKEKAGEIIDLVDEYGAKCLEKYGTRMFFCADEFYIKAERPLPAEEYYEEYQQLDNGVGMLRSTMNEFLSGLEDAESGDVASFTVATGKAAEPFIARLVAEAKKKFPQLRGEVVGIVNDFFGHTITVSGLVTAQDLITQLKDRPTLGERVLIPANMLRHGEGGFLDDYTVEQVEQAEYVLHFKYWAGFFCVVGHMFPCTAKFRGGKGILCSATLTLLLDWRIALVCWSLFAVLWLTTRSGSLGSVSAAAVFPVMTHVVFGDAFATAFSVLIAALVLFAHRENIKRLLNGTENKFRFHVNAPKSEGEA